MLYILDKALSLPAYDFIVPAGNSSQMESDMHHMLKYILFV